MISILLLSLFSPLANAALLAPDFQLSSPDGTTPDGTTIDALAAPGFHFNLDAPHGLEMGSEKIKASKQSERELDFALSHSGTFVIRAYLCDDKKTFCEKHVVQGKWDGKSISLDTSKTLNSNSDLSEAARETNARDEHGFYSNQADLAFSEAARKKLPVMIDFYGIWCPPCNELNETVFGTETFKTQAKNFILLKMDADSEVSWKLKDQYKIQGYPTLVFATASGEEISRVVGYRDSALLAKNMKEAFHLRNESFSVLKKKADQGDRTAQDKLGQIYLDRAEFKEAQTYLKGTKKFPEKFVDAQLGELAGKDDAASKKQIAAIAQAAIAKYPQSPSTLDWYEALSGAVDGSEKDNALRGLVSSSRKLLGRLSSLKGYDLTKEDLLEEIAENLEQLKDPGAKQAWKDAAMAYQEKLHSPNERGYNLENAYCLWKSGDEAAARDVYERLRKRYPSEFTFHYAEARMEMELQHTQAAEPLALAAFENSYGDNKLRATLLYAQILKKEGKTQEAKTAVAQTLSLAENAPDGVRTNRHLKALREFAKD